MLASAPPRAVGDFVWSTKKDGVSNYLSSLIIWWTRGVCVYWHCRVDWGVRWSSMNDGVVAALYVPSQK